MQGAAVWSRLSTWGSHSSVCCRAPELPEPSGSARITRNVSCPKTKQRALSCWDISGEQEGTVLH